MKTNVYNSPKIEITELDASDVITTSPGTETTPRDESDGVWNLDFGTAEISYD